MAAKTDLPILILGESGTGKTILARAIHNSSARRRGLHRVQRRGAERDAARQPVVRPRARRVHRRAERVKGKFELANTGTLFLDEVAI
jgi:DNA-binding NtrC family response regulator